MKKKFEKKPNKLQQYEEKYRIAVDDYCSSPDPTSRTSRGLKNMIRYSKKIDREKRAQIHRDIESLHHSLLNDVEPILEAIRIPEYRHEILNKILAAKKEKENG